MKRLRPFLAALACVSFVVCGMIASSAAASTPTKESFGPVEIVFPDFFSIDPNSPQCSFAVVGDWQVQGWFETFYDTSGDVVRTEGHLFFVGTLSSPLTGKSVPDTGHFEVTDYFAPDGSFIKETEEGVRTGFFKAAFRSVTDSEFNIVFDVGRDWLLTAEHPVSIAPVCAALS
jgi:hypothetical protein